jgi:chemotaxis protein MotB
MFDLGSAKLKDYTKAILKELAGYLDSVPNHITLSGHTDTTPYVAQNGYTNWDLSADRANAARRALEAGGLNPDKISRVVGLSSSVLFDKTNTRNPINRRISIIVMTRQAEESALKVDDSAETLSPTPTPVSTPTPTPGAAPSAVPAVDSKADAPAGAAPAATVPAVGGGTSAPALASHS